MFRKMKEEPKNTEGLTHDEFIEKHKDIPKLAEICWYFGVQPDQLKAELQRLLEK